MTAKLLSNNYAIKSLRTTIDKTNKRKIKVSKKARKMAEDLGLGRDRDSRTDNLLENMVLLGDYVQHEKGNRLYRGYIIDYRSNTIHGVYTHDGREQILCPDCLGSCRNKQTLVLCDTCNNQGIIILA